MDMSVEDMLELLESSEAEAFVRCLKKTMNNAERQARKTC
jgi:hypothetical protein